MPNSMPGLIGHKVGMTQLFTEDGDVTGVTVVNLGPCTVLQVKTADTNDGYYALQLGIGEQKASRSTQAELGHAKKAGLEAAPRHVAEIRVTAELAGKYSAGDVIKADDVFAEGDIVDITGTSKGRGFAGVMKRHNFAGFIRSHGTHEFFRHGGSIGTRLTPGHVLKGKKMPGHMGSEQVTQQNIRVAKVDAERGLLFLAGSVPGPKGGFIKVRKAVKHQ